MYLISNDMDMLEDLSKLAGTTHVSRVTGKTFSKKHGAVEVIDENVSYNVQENEERLFTVDDLMSFTNGEAMVLTAVSRAGNSGEAVRPNPIHNTKDRLLPMAWALHEDGHNSKKFKTEFNNAEVATSVTNNNVIDDIPDFNRLYEKRIKQASYVKLATDQYREQIGVSEDELVLMDSDTVADEIMRRINAIMNHSVSGLTTDAADNLQDAIKSYDDNKEQIEEASKGYVNNDKKIHQKDRIEGEADAKLAEAAKTKKRYLNETLSYRDFETGDSIQTVLTNVVFNQVQRLSDVLNTDLYKIETQPSLDDFNQQSEDIVLVDKIYGYVIARLEPAEDNDDDTTNTNVDRWSVTENFLNLLKKEASKGKTFKVKINKGEESIEDILLNTIDDVEDCFNITNENIVDLKGPFIKQFKEDYLQNE